MDVPVGLTGTDECDRERKLLTDLDKGAALGCRVILGQNDAVQGNRVVEEQGLT